MLEKCDADITIQDSNRDTPLHEACLHGESDIVELLLNKMKKCRHHGQEGKINLLIRNHLGLTPFHLACQGGHLEIARKLYDDSDQPLDLIADRDKEGATALHLACQKDQPDLVEFLLSSGADDIVFAHKNDGMTSLHIAAQHGSRDVMKLLLSNVNIDINVKDKYEQTPLHFAAEYGKVEMMQLLMIK